MTKQAKPAVAKIFLRHHGDVFLCHGNRGWDGLLLGPFQTEPAPSAVEAGVAAVIGADASALTVARTADLGDADTVLEVVDPQAGADHHQITVDPPTAVVAALVDIEHRQFVPSNDEDCVCKPATALLDPDAAPDAWQSYQRVAPTMRSITADDEHGASTLSIRALELLRDRAGTLVAEDEPDATELTDLARRVCRARPSMAVLQNRCARAIAGADTPEAVHEATVDGIGRAVAADRETAFRAAGLVKDNHVATLSRSGTVLDALGAGTAAQVAVATSAPGNEGIGTAESLADDLPVVLHTDAATAHVLANEGIDLVLVGADTILPDGRIVNKTGTRGLALAAAHEGIPVYAAAATDKISTEQTVNLETGDTTAVYDGDTDLDALNPTFDVTPAAVVDGIVTERGLLEPEDVGAIADDLASIGDDAGL